MKKSGLKSLLLLSGTAEGLIGLVILGQMLLQIFLLMLQGWNIDSVVLLLFWMLPIVIGGYLVYSAFSIWFRFSPPAIRRVVGTLILLVMGVVFHHFHLGDQTADRISPGFAFVSIGSLLCVWIVYWIISSYLTRLFFQSAPVA